MGTHSNVDWPVVLAFAAASMAGGLLGGPLTKRASASTLTTVFGVLLLGVCAVTAGSVGELPSLAQEVRWS